MTYDDRTSAPTPGPRQVPAPELDPARREALLQAVLADPGPGRRTRPWVVPLAAAASVGAIAGLGVTVLGEGGDRARDGVPAATDATSTTPATTPAPSAVPFTLGRLDAAAAHRISDDCIASMGVPPGDFTVSYAQRVQDGDRPGGVVVTRDSRTGTTLLCTDAGDASMIAGPDAKSDVVPPTPGRPLTYADGGGTSASSTPGGPITELATYGAFRAADGVARVEMRVGTKAAPGVWRSSTPDHGYVYVGAYLDREVRPDEPLFLEVRAYDDEGQPVTGPAPLGRQQLDVGLMLRTAP